MKQNFVQFFQKSVSNFAEAIVNITIFLPYFFSVRSLMHTLFSPWKSIISKKTGVGFSFDEWLNRFFYNFISRGIGFVMRISILSFYFLFQITYIILLPVLFFLYLLIIPLLYFEYYLQPSSDEQKKFIKQKFIKERCLNPENTPFVEQWFENYYLTYVLKNPWWKIKSLFSIPPLARDWAVGYTPTVDQYAFNLNHIDYQKQKKHIVNRTLEIRLIEQALSKTNGANVIIVGETGVGKHTIIDAFSKKIYEGKTISTLMYKRILKLDMEKVLNEFTDTKQREYFFDTLLSEATESKSVILMIENIDRYLSPGDQKIDLSTSLQKFALASGVHIIGTTTPYLYEKIIASNEKLTRMFEKVDVAEVSQQDAMSILLDVAFDYEFINKVVVSYEALKAIVSKSEFYITNIPFPEKAVELLDNCCVYVANKYQGQKNIPTITLAEVDLVLAEKTHMPISLTDALKEKLLDLEKLLLNEIVDQNQAISTIASTLRRSFILMGKRKKPISSFLFLGPTGVGKTQTAKTIAKVFFSDSSNFDYLLRFDMSLYQTKSDIVKLIGSLDSGDPGLLTATIRQHQYGVLLLDEIEKADKELLNIFLTIIDEGYFTDGFGKRVDCKNLVIVATSNAGNDYEKIFLPEFLNRFDGIIQFQPLSQNAVIAIAKKQIKTIAEDIYKLHKVRLVVSDQYLSEIAQKGYDPKFGARNMERLIRTEIEDKVAKIILTGRIENDSININN